MKVALLVSGLSKTSYFCIETNLINIIKKLNCDVFIYIRSGNFLISRDNNGSNLCKNNKNRNEKLLYEKLLEGYLKKIYIETEDTNTYKNEYNEYVNNIKCTEVYKQKYLEYGYIDQYLRLKKVCELMEEYETKNNFKYDYVIRLRLDILNLFHIDLKKLNKNITLASKLIHNNETYFTKDCFFFGKRNFIVKICKEFVSKIGSYQYPLFNNFTDYCVEVQFYRYITNTFMITDYDFIDYYVVPKKIKVNIKNHENWKKLDFYSDIIDDIKKLNNNIEIYVACIHKNEYMIDKTSKQLSITNKELQELYDANNKLEIIKYL